MLCQIALYKNIKVLISETRGFQDETRVRLAGLDPKKDRALMEKYHSRMEQSEKAVKALWDLHKTLDE